MTIKYCFENKFLKYLKKKKKLPVEKVNRYKHEFQFLRKNHPCDINIKITQQKIDEIIKDEYAQKDNRRSYSSPTDIEEFRIILKEYLEFCDSHEYLYKAKPITVRLF